MDQLGRDIASAREGIGRVIFGQPRVVEETLITLLAGGHLLLIGVPGLGKTRLVETLGIVFGLENRRVQFTPDLMPADILGSEVLEESETGRRSFRFIRGPVFCQLLMADEINRASPRTQSALLQAMQERRVSVAGHYHELPSPFHVLATQNPLEQEGTYPLPEAQLDRFMLNIEIKYPPYEDEVRIVVQTTSPGKPTPNEVMDGAEILRYQELVRRVPASPFVVGYAVSLSQGSRPQHGNASQFVKDYVEWGAGPRASQYLILGAKARTLLQGRYAVSAEDIRALASSVLRHRIIPNFKAQAEGLSSVNIVTHLLDEIKPPTDGSELG